MTRAYYNEHDAGAAEWLRNLIAAGRIAPGDVDTRSIEDVAPTDLVGYTQVHLFAGIGGWSLALRLAGVPDDCRVWTGSCPCQPFSSAGKGDGVADERHLWPAMLWLVRNCRPQRLFGEQVAAAVGHGWIDGVCADLAAENYASGYAVLGAHSVGAPHIRQRLYWGSVRVADGCKPGLEGGGNIGHRAECPAAERDGGICNPWAHSVWWPCRDGKLRRVPARRMGHAARDDERGNSVPGGDGEGTAVGGSGGGGGGVPDAEGKRWEWAAEAACEDGGVFAGGDGGGVRGGTGYVGVAVEPGLFPLADGVPGRVAALRGAGNAIVPQVAAVFVREFLESTR